MDRRFGPAGDPAVLDGLPLRGLGHGWRSSREFDVGLGLCRDDHGDRRHAAAGRRIDGVGVLQQPQRTRLMDPDLLSLKSLSSLLAIVLMDLMLAGDNALIIGLV